MHAWESIQKALDYIEEHISKGIDINDLANIAALSPFYFQRLFTRLVGESVGKYIKLRRLARSENLLKNSGTRIVDIALECGFGNHDTFTRAFKESYGMTPEQYRDNPLPLNHFIKPELLLKYTIADEGVPLISDGIVLEINRIMLDEPIEFLGFAGQIPITEMVGGEKVTGVDNPGVLWEKFHLEKRFIPEKPQARHIGVAHGEGAAQGHFIYYVGAEVLSGTEDKRFIKWVLPAREYFVCGFEAENFEELTRVALDKAILYCGNWMEQKGYVFAPFVPELYYDDSPQGTYMEVWYPFIPAEQPK